MSEDNESNDQLLIPWLNSWLFRNSEEQLLNVLSKLLTTPATAKKCSVLRSDNGAFSFFRERVVQNINTWIVFKFLDAQFLSKIIPA